MSVEPTLHERIRVPHTPTILQRLTEVVRNPADIDAATRALGCPPYLLNVHLATPADLSPCGLGPALFIPVQISPQNGGRKSLLDLDVGEEVLFGIYATDKLGIAHRLMTRQSGTGSPAQTGDQYSTRLTTLDNEVLCQSQGLLEITDPETGTIEFKMPNPFRCRCIFSVCCIF